MTPGLVVTFAVVGGLATALLTPSVLRRLPEPAGTALPEPPEVKIPYAELATGRFAMVIAGASGAAVGASAALLPPRLLPGWLVLSTVGVLLAAIDARTTWLPLVLTRAAWLAMAIALALTCLLGDWLAGLRGAIGFLIAGAVFWAVWRLSAGGMGFGDVRFAPLLGAATASVSWTLLAWGLVLGSLIGAAVGVVRLTTRRRGPFAYAPSILAGGYLAIALAWLTT
jgi:leader peptidase (prepilin peptidase)/N-methyltransferase